MILGAMVALPACTGNIEPMDPQALPDDAPDASLPAADAGSEVPDPTVTEPDPGEDDVWDPEEEPAADGDEPAADGAGPAETGALVSGATASGPDAVWTNLSVLQVLNPLNYGAVGNGTTDDSKALAATVNALPANGGVVYFPTGKSFKKTNLLTITKSHVKLWAMNRDAEIFQSIAGQARRQAILFRGATGSGVFGLKLRSDAKARFSALEDNQIAVDSGRLVEIVGNEINGSAAAGMFFYGPIELYVDGNYVHHTWADHIHHTHGTTLSWVWNNWMYNQAPSKGDDGIACVTYGVDSKRCSDMEWWKNTILHTDNGRGFAVVGGNGISIHDNWAIGVAGAGVLVATEAAYTSSASQGITVTKNYITNCGHTIGHPGMLVSGSYSPAGPIRDVALNANVVVNIPRGPYRAEGMYTNVTNTSMNTSAGGLPAVPTAANIAMADTRVLRTRDTSFAPAATRAGMHRIHVRRAPTGTGFQQRFEYVVKGTQADVTSFVQTRLAAGDYLSEQRTADNVAYALLLTRAPVTIPTTLTGLAFRELREKDRNGKLTWLWTRTDRGTY